MPADAYHAHRLVYEQEEAVWRAEADAAQAKWKASEAARIQDVLDRVARGEPGEIPLEAVKSSTDGKKQLAGPTNGEEEQPPVWDRTGQYYEMSNA